MQGRGQLVIEVLAALAGVALLCGCPEQATTFAGEADAVALRVTAGPVSLAGRMELRGGDQQAWLTPAGDIADTNYCRGTVRFPIETAPAWEYEYTAARFSHMAVNTMLHYDGLLVATARSSQLLGLDAATGAEVFNQDVYLHMDNQNQEQMSQIIFHPAGLLFGSDNLGRFYCWEVTDDGLAEQWTRETGTGNRPMVTAGDGFYSTWDDVLHGLSLAAGEEEWIYPSLAESGGVVLADNELLVAWTALGEFNCVDTGDGTFLWSVYTGTDGRDWATRAVISNERGEVFLVLPDERLQCRDLTTGELRWEHCWTDLLPAEERRRHFADFGADPIPLWAAECCVGPAGVSLVLLHGQVINIDYTGRRTWTYDSDVLTLGGGAFANAVMITEWYLGTEYRRQINAGWQSFITDPLVGWERFDAAPEFRRLNGTFMRFVWLDPVSGAVLARFEPDYPINTIIPARDKIILGEALRNDTSARRILAYNWLNPEVD